MAKTIPKSARHHDWLLPILLGTATFVIVIGPQVLYPSNIAWLASGDLATYYLGWQFFRKTAWQLPLGSNPNYGLELANAIVYSDSNPVFAIPFKLFSTLLPEPFQYFGIWLLLCYVLQAVFAWKLVGLLSKSTPLKFLGTGLFAFAPPMLHRYGHLNLGGHFLILAALYLAFVPELKRRWSKWGVLLAVAALVNAYLLALVILLWCADLGDRALRGEKPIIKSCIEISVLLPFVALACWQAGYFTVGSSVSSAGYGYYKMNLLSVIDSNNWSYVLGDLPGGEGDYEGFNFLGLGVIVLWIIAIPSVIGGYKEFSAVARKKGCFLGALVCLTIFAATNSIGIGWRVFEVPLPAALINLANVFRSSGRMFWPVFYTMVLASVYLTIRANSKSVAIACLGVALSLQIVDTSAGWRGLRKLSMVEPSSQWSTSLQDPFWQCAASRYSQVKWLLPSNASPHWQALSYYAATQGLSTDSVYLARMDSNKLNLAKKQGLESLNSGKYDLQTLYVLEDSVQEQAKHNLDSHSDLLTDVDGLHVLAPGWNKFAECSGIRTGQQGPLLDRSKP